MTPLWEELAAQTPDAAAAIKKGEDAQVKHREPASRKKIYYMDQL